MKEALIAWCENESHPRTAKIPERMREYLKNGKPVYYAPIGQRIAQNYPAQINIVYVDESRIDGYDQDIRIVNSLKTNKITSVEVCGPSSDECLEPLVETLLSHGINAEINMEYSATFYEITPGYLMKLRDAKEQMK